MRCDIDEYELSRSIKAGEKKYQTDARDFLRMLLEEEAQTHPDYTGWKNQCLRVKEFLSGFDLQPGNYAVKKISSLLPEDPVVSVDVGMNQCWCAQSLELKGDNGRIHISGGYGTMGCALPFAIGSAIAVNSPGCTEKKPVFCIAGDGGFQMNIQELETVHRENLPVKIFILNNRVLGKISETQHFNHADRFAATTMSGGYTVPRFDKIAEAYGIRAAALTSPEDLEDYKEWINDENPCLLDIPLPEESFLTPKN